MRLHRSLLTALLLLGAVHGLIGQTSPPPRSGDVNEWERMKDIRPRGYVCRRADRPPVIDGKLDDPAWRRAPASDLFVDIEGDRRPRPAYATRVRMLWDDTFFYVGAELEEPHVWGTLTAHDSVNFRDNDFEVFIDPDGDNHEYYEFEINALGTGWDLFLPRPYKDGGKADNGWEIPGLRTAVHVDGTLNQPADQDRGWSVELAFPWRVLAQRAHRPAPPREGDQWRVNFSRVEWQVTDADGRYRKVEGRREDNWVWSPQGIIDMHRPERWGYVQFTGKRGRGEFRPDPVLPARDALMSIYHAQRVFNRRERRWASSLDELGITPSPTHASFIGAPAITLEDGGYRASVRIRLRRGRREQWNTGPDSRIWKE
jgi:hypothetical protein